MDTKSESKAGLDGYGRQLDGHDYLKQFLNFCNFRQMAIVWTLHKQGSHRSHAEGERR